MKKALIVAVIIVIALVVYFWRSQPASDVAGVTPEDQTVIQEIQDVSVADLETEFQEIDAALNEL